MTTQEIADLARKKAAAQNVTVPVKAPAKKIEEEDPSYALAKQEADIAMGRDPGAKVVPKGSNTFSNPEYDQLQEEARIAMGRPATTAKNKADIALASGKGVEIPYIPATTAKDKADIELASGKGVNLTTGGYRQASPETKTPADSATELATASPSQAGAVIDKLKEEEKKGGPNFFDIIEAAAAGFNGKVPLYIQKEIKAKEQQGNLNLLQQQNAADQAKQAANYKAERDLERQKEAADISLFERNAALEREKAGIVPLGTVGKGLSLAELSGFKGI